jgi:hypothetical protein
MEEWEEDEEDGLGIGVLSLGGQRLIKSWMIILWLFGIPSVFTFFIDLLKFLFK